MNTILTLNVRDSYAVFWLYHFKLSLIADADIDFLNLMLIVVCESSAICIYSPKPPQINLKNRKIL